MLTIAGSVTTWFKVILRRNFHITITLRMPAVWAHQCLCVCVFYALQTHPNVDKKLFTAESVIGLKNPEKSFPLNNDVGVLKWRLQTTDESLIPLTSKSHLYAWSCDQLFSNS